ncbi:hypothetical protein KJ733_06825 [Patescibacteria group bacterium]|nr:hypothetical protein [Patescibacteria group bacterium]
MKSSIFVFLHAIGSYIILLVSNSIVEGFIGEFFNIKIPLVVALISGFIFVMSYLSDDETKDNSIKVNAE